MARAVSTFLLFYFLMGAVLAKAEPQQSVLVPGLTAMTYNIRMSTDSDKEDAWDHRKADVAALINYYSPTFLGVQEALSEQVKYLDSNLIAYQSIGVGRDDGLAAGEFMSIYFDTTRVGLLNSTTFWLSETPENPSMGWDAACFRTCTYGRFIDKTTLDTLHVFNTHYDHIGKLARKNSSRLLLQKIEALVPIGAAVIVMGDFNSSPTSEQITVLSERIGDAFAKTKNPPYGPIGTFSGFKLDHSLDRRIDYIFSTLGIKSYRTISDKRPKGRWPSDHLPVLVKFDPQN